MSAIARNIRQSPRKVRLVASLIRGLGVSDALAQLSHTTKAARMPIEKLLHSAVANAENNFQKSREHLFVQEIRVDEAAVLRRWRPRAFGRAAPIRKAACHIIIGLSERPGASVGAVSAEGVSKSAPSVVASKKGHVALPHGGDDHEPMQNTAAPPKEIFDASRAGRHETAQERGAKEKKSKGFMKKIIQRKTG